MALKTEQELALERTYELARKKKARASASHLLSPRPHGPPHGVSLPGGGGLSFHFAVLVHWHSLK